MLLTKKTVGCVNYKKGIDNVILEIAFGWVNYKKVVDNVFIMKELWWNI